MSQKAFSKIWILIVVAAIAAGGFLAWQYARLPEGEISPLTKPLKPVPQNDTTNWKSYRNEKYGFEVKYPEEWSIDVGDAMSDAIHWTAPDKGWEVPWVMDLMVSERNGKTANEWIQKEDPRRYIIIKEIEIEGDKGVIVRDAFTMGSDYHIVFFPEKEYMYSIGIASNPPKIPGNPVVLLEQILSTFRFLE